MKIQKAANILARSQGKNRATKVILGTVDRVLETTECGYRKTTTGEYVPSSYRSNFGWKNTYYQKAECIVELDVSKLKILNSKPILFVLGAQDPEMEAIESLLKQQNIPYTHAMHNGKRVHPGNATKADRPTTQAHLFCVECKFSDMSGTTIFDHHSEGDPGFGRPPKQFWEASSLGQVVEWIETHWTDANIRKWEHPYIAAADHCLGAAYKGLCPGIKPDSLLFERTNQKSKFQNVPAGEIRSRIEQAKAELEKAPKILIVAKQSFDGSQPKEFWVKDMRRPEPVPELPEAATFLGEAYISGPLKTQDGREKYTVSGEEQIVKAWIEVWAPKHGIKDIYGDPVRGFAGGYSVTSESEPILIKELGL